MKTPAKILLLLLASALLGASLAVAQSGEGGSAAAPLTPEAQGFLLSLLTAAVAKWPALSVVVAFVGSMRLWAKPLFGLVHHVIELTPSRYDNDLWARAYDFLTKHPAGRTLAWLLDWLGSVKLVPPGATQRDPAP